MKVTEERIKNKCNDLMLIYKEYKREKSGVVVYFVCEKHKDKGVQHSDWKHFKNAKYGCKYCVYDAKTLSTDILVERIKDRPITLLSEYIGNEKPITCKCNVCNNVWTTLPKVLVTNRAGCPKCGRLKANKHESLSHDEFINKLNKVQPNIEVLSKYNGSHKYVKCKCKICGGIWESYACNLLNMSAGCCNCNISTGESKMVSILKNKGFIIEQQKMFDNCKNIKNLRFDAYDPVNKIAYEYNGEQHYRPVVFASQNKEIANRNFVLTVKRDKIKEEFCCNNNIKLIIVLYWEKINMQQFLDNKLNNIQ